MFPIDSSLFFNMPMIYYGSEDIDEEFESEEEFDPPPEEIQISPPSLNRTGTYLYWQDL